MIVIITLVLSLLLNGVLLFVCRRLGFRLLQFDDLFHLLADDIDTNTIYLKKLTSTPLFENSPEIKTANKNMSIIALRLDEFSQRIAEIANKNIPKKEG